MASMRWMPPQHSRVTATPGRPRSRPPRQSAIFSPTLSSVRTGLPIPMMMVSMVWSPVAAEGTDALTGVVVNVDHQGHGARKRMRGAGQAGVVEAKCHFDAVQQALLH